MNSMLIFRAVSIWLDRHPAFRACGSCACGCNDLTRFICFDGHIDDLEDIMRELIKDTRNDEHEEDEGHDQVQ